MQSHHTLGPPRATVTVIVFLLLLAGCAGESADSTASPENTEAAATSTPGTAMVTGSVPVTAGLPSIVTLVPVSPNWEPDAPGRTPAMDQMALNFLPGILLVRTGYPVQFGNGDEVLHNVRVLNSVTKAPSFNVAIPTGGSYQHTFTEDGFYDVGCDIHPGMSALVVATSTPYATLTDREGMFHLADVPTGAATVTAYAGPETLTSNVDVKSPETEIHVGEE